MMSPTGWKTRSSASAFSCRSSPRGVARRRCGSWRPCWSRGAGVPQGRGERPPAPSRQHAGASRRFPRGRRSNHHHGAPDRRAHRRAQATIRGFSGHFKQWHLFTGVADNLEGAADALMALCSSSGMTSSPRSFGGEGGRPMPQPEETDQLYRFGCGTLESQKAYAEVVGFKVLNLIRMVEAGLPVPPASSCRPRTVATITPAAAGFRRNSPRFWTEASGSSRSRRG